MYTNHYGTEEYPFFATFYHYGVDESKPLDEQVEEKVLSYETKCDISDRTTNLDNNSFTLRFPFNADIEDVAISIGENVEVNTYGLMQIGRVLGVFPSTLGGVSVLCLRI